MQFSSVFDIKKEIPNGRNIYFRYLTEEGLVKYFYFKLSSFKRIGNQLIHTEEKELSFDLKRCLFFELESPIDNYADVLLNSKLKKRHEVIRKAIECYKLNYSITEEEIFNIDTEGNNPISKLCYGNELCFAFNTTFINELSLVFKLEKVISEINEGYFYKEKKVELTDKFISFYNKSKNAYNKINKTLSKFFEEPYSKFASYKPLLNENENYYVISFSKEDCDKILESHFSFFLSFIRTNYFGEAPFLNLSFFREITYYHFSNKPFRNYACLKEVQKLCNFFNNYGIKPVINKVS